MTDNKLILGFPREIKIQVLKDALKEDKFNIYFELSKILLDAPIPEGGLESEIIEQIFDEHKNNRKNNN